MSYLVSIDGLSGSGKSTAIAAVKAALEARHLHVNVYHDRLGEPTARRIDALQHGAELSPLARLYFMLAMRRQVIDGAIIPSLAKDDVTITDRYYTSTIAYQGYGQGLDPVMVRALAFQAASGAIPERIIYLDVPADIALERMAARGEAAQVFDAEAAAFHERVREGYRIQAADHPKFTIIDATQARENVVRDVLAVIDADLNDRKPEAT